MADKIDWLEVVGTGTLDDGGFVGDLMNIGLSHINKLVDDSRITQSQAGEVYASLIASSQASAIQFALQSASTDAQIADTEANTTLKAAQLVAERNKTEAELEKQWGYDVTRDPITDELILGAKVNTGLIDKQNTKLNDDIHNQEWSRQANALKMQLDAEVSLYSSKRLDKLPSIINGDESATDAYEQLIDDIRI